MSDMYLWHPYTWAAQKDLQGGAGWAELQSTAKAVGVSEQVKLLTLHQE